MAFYIGTEPQKLKQAEAGFARVLRELHEKPLSAGDLERGVNRMEADYYRARQTLASRSGEAAGLSVLHRPLDFAREQIDKARRLKPKDIQALVGKYFKPETAYTARVLP